MVIVLASTVSTETAERTVPFVPPVLSGPSGLSTCNAGSDPLANFAQQAHADLCRPHPTYYSCQTVATVYVF